MARVLAGASTVGYLAGAVGLPQDEAAIIGELRSGSEEAYEWLIAHYHQPVYSLVYRILNDPADAADTTQEVFLKVYRGIKRFNGDSSLKTWIYRIAVHEASNQRRWWFRHKRKEDSMETPIASDEGNELTLEATLVDAGQSPFEQFEHEEVRARVEAELKQVPEPYRTAVVLRDIEGLAYEEIAAVLDVSLGTVKSRLTRGREALRKRLLPYVKEVGEQLGLEAAGSGAKRSIGMEAKTRI
jgi:RNA polymerase sigma-70 factor, ECF subfamily